MTVPFASFRVMPLRSYLGRPSRPSLCRQFVSIPTRLNGASPTTSNRCSSSGIFIVASASLAVVGYQSQSNRTTHLSSNKRRPGAPSPPPIFGPSVLARYTHTESFSEAASQDEKDCPICRKYSQGPCGTIFRQWLKCTDDNTGINPKTKQEWHLEKCSHLATPLAECLDKHKEFYDNLGLSDEVEVPPLERQQDLRNAWDTLIQQVEESASHVYAFPRELIPDLQIKPKTGAGMAAFVYDHKNRNSTLILAYVKDADTGQLLAAGSLEDMWEWEGNYGVLRLMIPESTRRITAFALYGAADESLNTKKEPLYSYTLLVPPRPISTSRE